MNNGGLSADMMLKMLKISVQPAELLKFYIDISDGEWYNTTVVGGLTAEFSEE